MSSEHSDAETIPMDASWFFDAVPSSPPTSVDEEGAAAAKHYVVLAEETEPEIELPGNKDSEYIEELEPPKAPKKRGRPKKTGDAATPKTPAKRGRKPKAAAAGEEGEDGEPAAKKRRVPPPSHALVLGYTYYPQGRPAKAKADAPATAPAEPSTPAAPATPAKPATAPATPAKPTTAPTTPAKPATPAKGVKPSCTGTSTAMTHVECEYIFNSMIDAINWGNVVKETNKMAGKERQAGNVKTHWNGLVRKAIMGLYKA
ncbi:hypothetical protein K440DRAFT_638608 [Wilcoxina mikolae CBS 423.85]|nr:hypothetical protein K440DRAFT_638608 [Wilcoxina mikolae CBS 423.85]